MYYYLRRRLTSEDGSPCGNDCSLQLPYNRKIIKESAGRFFEENSEKKKILIESADSAVSGKIKIFNHDISTEDFTAEKFDERRREKDICSRDVRFHWEIYRAKYLLDMGFAYLVTSDETYAGQLKDYISVWRNFSPLAHPGVPYNAMEAALKIVNLSMLHLFLDGSPVYGEKESGELVNAIIRHAGYIYKNYEITFYGLESNHGLSGSIGLIYASVILPKHASSKKWYNLGIKTLKRGLRNQFKDGVNYESSLHYYRFTIELLLVVLNALQYAGKKEADTVGNEVKKIIEGFLALRHSNNMVPRIGDSDGGKILFDLGTIDEFNSVEYLDWFAGKNEKMFPETLIFEGNDKLRHLISLQDGRTRVNDYLSFRGNNLSLVVAGHGIGTSGKGNHQHNDFLSFEFYGIRPFIVDPWSYCYTGNPDLRNLDRSTSSHNCVKLDDTEIINYDDSRLFQMSGNINVKFEEVITDFDYYFAKLSHNAYKSLPAGQQICRRSFRLDRRSGELVITDELTGKGEHTAEINFSVPADYWEYRPEEDGLLFYNDSEKFHIVCPGNGFTLSRGNISEMFLSRSNSHRLKIVKKYSGSVKIETIIRRV